MKYLATFLVLMAPAFSPVYAQAVPVSIAIGTADAIVVADITSGTYSGGQYSVMLTIRRSLQGPLTVGSAVQVVYAASDKPTRAGLIVKEQGLFFLRNTQPAWTIISIGSRRLGLSYTYDPIMGVGPATTAAGVASAAPVQDLVIQELATSATSAQDPAYALRFISTFSANSSPIVAQTLLQWAAMPISALHTYGLAGLIASGNSAAVQQFAAELPQISKLPNAAQAGSSLHGFHNSDPLADKAIGVIATTPGTPVEIRNAAVWALSNSHSKHTLPYLYTLLSSPDELTRSLAVGGFSAFVTNMRVSADGLDSAEARDAVLNPGRVAQTQGSNFDTPATRRFVHFGPFQNPQDEQASIAFWTSWFNQNRLALAL